MKKLVICILMLSTLFLIGCSPKEITEDELSKLLEAEFNGEIIELSIIKQDLNENSLDVESSFAIDVDGIGQEGVLNIKCLYDDEEKMWQMHYANVDSQGWTYFPIKSALEKVDFDDQKAFMFGGFKGVSIGESQVNYSKQESNFSFSNIGSFEFNKATGTDKIRFDLTYEDDFFIGTTECVLVMEFIDSKWRYKEVYYEPIVLNFKDTSVIKAEIQGIIDEYENSFSIPSMRVEDQDYQLNSEHIKSFEFTSEPIIEDIDFVSVIGEMELDLNIASIKTDVKAYYSLEYGKWEFASLEFINKPTFTYKRDLVLDSVWEGYFLINKKVLATLKVNNYLETANQYEGILSFGPSDTSSVEEGSYHITLEYDVRYDRILVEAGEWINKPDGYSTVDFIITFDDDKLVGNAYSNHWMASKGIVDLKLKDN